MQCHLPTAQSYYADLIREMRDGECGLTTVHHKLRQVLHIHAMLEVLSDEQVGVGGAQQVCQGLIVDLQEAALAQKLPDLSFLQA